MGASEASNEIEDPVILTKELPDPLSLIQDYPNCLKECNLGHDNNSIAEEPDIMESENTLSKMYLKMLAEHFLCFWNYLKVMKEII